MKESYRLKESKSENKWVLELNAITPWKQCDSGRACSEHLPDGKQSVAQPFTELKRGYEKGNSQIRK